MPGGHCVDGTDVRYNHEKCPKEKKIIELPPAIKVDAKDKLQENSNSEFNEKPISNSENIDDSAESMKEDEIFQESINEEDDNNNSFETFFEV